MNLQLMKSFCISRRIRTFGALRLGTLAVCWYRPLTHTSVWFQVQRYNTPMQPFCVARIILQEIIKKVVDSWNGISVFNLSTLELDNGWKIQNLAESFKFYSAEVWFCLATSIVFGYKLATNLKCIKKKSPVNRWFTGLFLRRFRMGLNQRPPD